MFPENFPNEFRPVEMERCGTDITSSADWFRSHCHTNAANAARATSGKVVWGIARLPYSVHVDEPERWRVHAWLSKDGRHSDPTYELAFGGELARPGVPIVYFEHIPTTIQPVDPNFQRGLQQVQDRARALGIDAVVYGRGVEPPSIELVLRGRVGTHRFEERPSVEHWVELERQLQRLDGLERSEAYVCLSWDEGEDVDADHVQFCIYGGNEDRFIVHRATSGGVCSSVGQDGDVAPSTESLVWQVLMGERSGPELTVGAPGRTVNARPEHVLHRDELVRAMESGFRRWIRSERWDRMDYF